MSELVTHQHKMQAFIGQLRRAYRRAAAMLTAVRLLWVALVVIAGLFALDAMIPLPAGMRVALLWSSLAFLLVVSLVTWLASTRVRSVEAYVVRRIERGNAGLENDLINALEFGRKLESAPPDEKITKELMHNAIDRAENEVAPIRDLSPLRPPNLRREGAMLVCCLGLFAVGLFMFNHVISAVLPRYLDPRGDHPPYSPTRIEVSPAGIEVDYGSQLVIKARTSGVPAREATLILKDLNGNELQRMAMFETDSGQFAQTVENVRQPMKYQVKVPHGETKHYALSLNNTPRIESVLLRLTSPEYTHQPEQERVLAQPIIKAYPKSVARLTITSNRPLSGGELSVGGRKVKLAREGENAVVGEVDLLDTSTLAAMITDVDGLNATEPWKGRVEILSDEKPTISITSPGMDSFAIPDTKLPIVIEASDDLGFRNMALVRNVNGSKDFRKVMVESDGTQNFLHAVEMLDLGDLGARPGDVITYYATATDSHPDSPKTAATQVYQLAIISFEEYRSFMQNQMSAEDLAEKYNEFFERMQDLAREQEELNKKINELKAKSEKGERLSKDEQDRLADAQQRQNDAARQAHDLAQDMREEAEKPPIFDVEKEFKEDLKKLADQVSEASEHMKNAGSEMSGASQSRNPALTAQQLDKTAGEQQEASKRLGETAEEYKQGVKDAADQVMRTAKLMEDVEKFKELYQRQKDVERQSRIYKDEANPGMDERVRMKELAQEQADIQQQLSRLASDMRAHAEEVKADSPRMAEQAQDIADEIGKRKIPSNMQQAGDKLGEADGPGGHKPANQAFKDMEEMIEFVESQGGGSGKMSDDLKIRMGKGGMQLGDTMKQLGNGMKAKLGRMGNRGQGSDGMSGGANPFGVFGTEKFGEKTKDSKIAGSPQRTRNSATNDPQDKASSIEELASARDEEKKIKVQGGESVMEEYRSLIEAYFQGLAEEN